MAGTNTGEFRVNATTLGNQVAPAVGFNDFENDAIVAWVGPAGTNTNATAIFDRDIDPPNTPASLLIPVTPAISASNTTVAVGASAAKATFTVNLSSPTTKPITVHYTTSNGTATADANYTAASGTLTFAPGQTSQTISVNVAGMAANGTSGNSFALNLTNPSSNATLARATAAATIYDAAPNVTTSPNNQAVNLGQPVTFTAAATGMPTPTVQWQVSPDGVNWRNIAGATSTTYNFTPTATMSGNYYQAVFTNAGGSVDTSAATLTINTAPVVTARPANKTVNVGVTATFTAAASGTPTPTVEWQTSTDGTTWTNITGATATSYTFAPTTAQNGLQYRALFTNSLGSVSTGGAALTVNPAATIIPTQASTVSGSTVTNLDNSANSASLSAAAVDAVMVRL